MSASSHLVRVRLRSRVRLRVRLRVRIRVRIRVEDRRARVDVHDVVHRLVRHKLQTEDVLVMKVGGGDERPTARGGEVALLVGVRDTVKVRFRPRVGLGLGLG